MNPVPQEKEKIQTPLLLIGALVFLTLGVSLLPSSWFGIQKQVTRYQPLNLGTLATTGTTAVDTDQDGVVSWREYIAQSLNISPEEATSSIELDPRDIAALNDKNNLTTSFTKNLYIASVALNQNGIDDPTTNQDTINQLIAKEAEKIKPVSYSLSSIRAGKDDSTSSLKTYGNSVASILNGMITEQSIAADLTAVGTYTTSLSEGDLMPVVLSEKKVSTALDKLLAVQAPPSLAQAHVQLVNAVGTYANTLHDLSVAFDDPVRATLALNHYPEDAAAIIHVFPLLAQFYKEKGITFSGKDAGYVYVVGYTGK